MPKKISPGAWVVRALIVLFLLVEIYPVIWMIMAAFKAPTEFSTFPAYALPRGLHVKNFTDAWTTGRMNIFFVNSLVSTTVSIVFIVFFATTASFALTKMRWKYSRVVYTIFSSGIMVPVTIVLIPLFNIYKKMGLLNSLTCLIITYVGFGLSLSIYLMTTYFKYVPDEIMESSVIDGCNVYTMLWHIVLPLVKNAVVTVVVIQFFFKWNDLIFSMTFNSKTTLKTIQTGLMYFSDEYGNKNWGAIFAAITMGVVPTLALYAGLNKLVIEGMTAGAVKG